MNANDSLVNAYLNRIVVGLFSGRNGNRDHCRDEAFTSVSEERDFAGEKLDGSGGQRGAIILFGIVRIDTRDRGMKG